MKKLLIPFGALLLCFFANNIQAQFLKKIKEKVTQKIDSKTDQVIDKTINGSDKKDKSASTTSENESTAESKGLKSYSHFDFIPGDKIIYSEDFSQDQVGELPLKWNTNGSGEIVTLDGLTGKWLQMKEQTNYTSPMKMKMPVNYTVEFDLLVEFKEDQRVPDIMVSIVKSLGIDASQGETVNKNAGITLKLKPNGGMSGEQDAAELNTYDQKGQIFFMPEKGVFHSEFSNLNKKGSPVHVAIWVQGERIRVWLNQSKIYDLPKALDKGVVPDNISFRVGTYGGPQNNYHYYLSNIKAAIATPDNRSKLITEGKWVTSGIMFDVNSDRIKETSYGVLKEIASVLIENPTVRVKIVGHTDSDGDDSKNLDLSKRRAAAVKNALASQFNIDASRMETDGMGETKPIADNKTSEGKAQNRRVEFIKL